MPSAAGGGGLQRWAIRIPEVVGDGFPIREHAEMVRQWLGKNLGRVWLACPALRFGVLLAGSWVTLRQVHLKGDIALGAFFPARFMAYAPCRTFVSYDIQQRGEITRREGWRPNIAGPFSVSSSSVRRGELARMCAGAAHSGQVVVSGSLNIGRSLVQRGEQLVRTAQRVVGDE
ncbi:MAG: hypothetical protein JWR36_1662 [Glaciihabitans sp.]|nr:hypothetical protein [Glaciihabitans sp.]